MTYLHPGIRLLYIVVWATLGLVGQAQAQSGGQDQVKSEAPKQELQYVHLAKRPWRFSLEDRPAFSRPDFDASKWRSVPLPDTVADRDSTVGAQHLWQWTRFDIPGQMIGKLLALRLGRIAEADEVWINGVRIGQTGRFIKRVRDQIGLSAAALIRVYPIPPSILKRTDNVLAIRTQSLIYTPRLRPSGAVIGPRAPLLREAVWADAVILIRDSMTLALLAVIGLFLSFSIVFGTAINRDRWLPACAFAYLAVAFSDSIVPAKLQILGSWHYFFQLLTPFQFFLILHHRAAAEIRYWKLLLAAAAAYHLLLLGAFIVNPSAAFFVDVVMTVAAFLMFTVFGGLFVTTLEAARRQRVSVWLILAPAPMVVAMIILAVAPSAITPAWDPILLAQVPVILCYLFAVAQHAAWDRATAATLSQRILTARESERERVARELHDGIAQRVAATRFRLEQLDREADTPGTAKKRLAQPVSELRETGQDIALLVESMRPVSLDPIRFAEQMDTSVERWNDLLGATITTAGTLLAEPDEATRQHVFRIVQEALNNAIRHGAAQSVRIGLGGDDRIGRVTIEDDGPGFDPDTVKSGYGLKTMHERAAIIGGSLTVRRSGLGGAKIDVRFDLRQADPGNADRRDD